MNEPAKLNDRELIGAILALQATGANPATKRILQREAQRRLAANNLTGIDHHQSQGWMPIESAPKDGTQILIRIHHPSREHCHDSEKHQWESNVKARWIDHNEGGWTWYGMLGTPITWRPLDDDPKSSVKQF